MPTMLMNVKERDRSYKKQQKYDDKYAYEINYSFLLNRKGILF